MTVGSLVVTQESQGGVSFLLSTLILDNLFVPTVSKMRGNGGDTGEAITHQSLLLVVDINERE